MDKWHYAAGLTVVTLLLLGYAEDSKRPADGQELRGAAIEALQALRWLDRTASELGRASLIDSLPAPPADASTQ